MTRYTSTLTLTIRGPVLTAGLEASAYGIDDSHLLACDGSGTPILPESLIRGNIVHVLREMRGAMANAVSARLSELDQVIRWLGAKSGDAYAEGPIGSLEPLRRAIRFDDLRLGKASKGRTITRIKLDSETGSVEHGSLQVVASPLDIGELGEFSGAITFDLDDDEARIAAEWVQRALEFVPAIGALKGAGFGRIAGVTLTLPEPWVSTVAVPKPCYSGSDPNRCVRFALSFDRPFLVASEAVSGNLFRSAIDVPGAAIKGALANEIKRRGLLPRLDAALDKLVIRHAKPSAREYPARPRAIPLSLYAINGHELRDALVDDPVVSGARGDYVEFQPDWKNGGKADTRARDQYGHTFNPSYDIRTRTKIGRGGAAEDGMLFTQMAVIPGGHRWIGEIEQAGVADRDFEAIMAVLSDGMHGLGKTHANARIEWLDAQPRTATKQADNGGSEVWRIVLETDAILHGPEDAAKPLMQHYRNYFIEAIAVGGGPKLAPAQLHLRFYASQRWVGGYQARRFPQGPGQHYYPQLVTIAGSVFELTLPLGCAPAMERFVQLGLPLPSTVGVGKKHQFERSAFNPENGYGEVSIEARDLTQPVEGV